ncbi:uncharacterized protein LOC130719419 [Lotus japonicus]|uniref:uncharacterized protein LOC130719419 n=1 Tax=Lotus japonicus TaxID=34305 RepID=UPI00258BE8B1|nr:uncharacterized protein LOC130719419 [Lotus japonicus]
MKLLTYNVRGLGSMAKRRVIRELVTKEQVELVCIQETKLEVMDRGLCAQIWGDSDFSWLAQPAVNRAGGLLCIWKHDLFKVSASFSDNGFLGLVGAWGSDDVNCVIVNVYSSCNLEEKRIMWASLLQWRGFNQSLVWCLDGDFNAVRGLEERRGISTGSQHQMREISEFNNFVTEMSLVDIPLAGRKFTWLRPNGQAQSRIDRFLVSHEWLQVWPNCSQLVLNRDISDHCPLLLRCLVQDWGPKPFNVLNCWFQDHRFPAFVKQSWEGIHIDGWGAFVLKQKLKALKSNLKSWNHEVFGDLRKRRNDAVQRINDLDKKEEEGGLSVGDIEERKQLLHEFWSVLKLHESLLCQKARSRWLKEGDQNSKFFHSMINWRRRSNSMVGLMVDGVWEETPLKVKEEVTDLIFLKRNLQQIPGIV